MTTDAFTFDDLEAMEWGDACEAFPGLEDIVADYPEEFEVRVHRGDLEVAGLRVAGGEGAQRVVVIAGDLRVAGVLDLAASQDEESGLVVLVTGDATAGDVSVFCDAVLAVQGSLATSGVVACGGGNFGRVEVSGRLAAGATLQFADNQLRVGGAVEGPVFRQREGTLAGAAAVVAAECVVDGAPDLPAIRRRLRGGQRVLA